MARVEPLRLPGVQSSGNVVLRMTTAQQPMEAGIHPHKQREKHHRLTLIAQFENHPYAEDSVVATVATEASDGLT